MTTGLVTIYCTAESEDVGMHIATALVKERLVACVNISDGTRSVYEDQGTLLLVNEVTLYMKTSEDKVEAAIARIKEVHTYQTPCIAVWPIVSVNEDYKEWVLNQLSLEEHRSLDEH